MRPYASLNAPGAGLNMARTSGSQRPPEAICGAVPGLSHRLTGRLRPLRRPTTVWSCELRQNSPGSQGNHATVACPALHQTHALRVEPDNAVRTGDASWARIVGANGRAVVDFNVNTKGGGGLIEFNTLAFRKGDPVSVMTRLSVPRLAPARRGRSRITPSAIVWSGVPPARAATFFF